jgi:pimeloyl-ACP methyl ester carboxylesterase
MPLTREGGEAVFPLRVPRGGATRRTLRVFMWAARPVQGPGALAVAARWERLRRPNQLLQWESDRVWRRADIGARARGPCLLLLHDTVGTPQSSFADWLSDESFGAVVARYGGRCLAFAHPTLAAGIADNAAWLAGILPSGIPSFDIVAHGRGGLVARALAADASVPVRRVVLVGTPNYGTPLARSVSLARWLDGNVAHLASLSRAGAIASLEGLLSVARFEALGLDSRLPGLEAQQPGSETLRAFEATGSGQRWFSIGANYECPTDAGTDPLPGDTPNDLVVPSDGCHLPTATPDDSLRIAGSQIHHHNYFSSPVARERLNSWLM